jgi:hypothetical protein
LEEGVVVKVAAVGPTFTTMLAEGLVQPLTVWVTVYVEVPTVAVLGVGAELLLGVTENCKLVNVCEPPLPVITKVPLDSVCGFVGEETTLIWAFPLVSTIL